VKNVYVWRYEDQIKFSLFHKRSSQRKNTLLKFYANFMKRKNINNIKYISQYNLQVSFK